MWLREAAKKSSSTSGRATKRGGGVKAGPLRKKKLFLKLFFLFCCHLKIKIIFKALVARPLVDDFFFAASLTHLIAQDVNH